MISIRRHIQADQTSNETLLQLTRLLLEGIVQHSMEGAPGELAHLHEGTERVFRALQPEVPPADLLGLAGAALQAMRENNRKAVENLRSPVTELQAKVRLLSDAVTSVAAGSTDNIRRLQLIKGRLISTLDVKEVRSLRDRLSQYLDGVLAEAERQRSAMDHVAEQLHRAGGPLDQPSCPARDSLRGEPPVDAATGLPTRAQAEEAIAQCCQDEVGVFVAIMVINQVETLNRSLGGHSGDVILQRFAGFVREQLPRIDRVFRWSGPTVVALLRRRSAPDVRSVIEPLLLQRLTVRIGNPDVQVPISARWTVLPLMASPRLLFRKMDVFAGVGLEPENSDSAPP